MPTVLTDADVERLLAERKPLPPDYRQRLELKPKRGHKQQELAVTGEAGSEFRLILRQSEANPLDFSVILAYCVPATNQRVRLRRYNGKSHEHTNSIEGDRFYDFHVHKATERYQQLGAREDAFAEPIQRYMDIQDAITCCLADCGFDVPPSLQRPLF